MDHLLLGRQLLPARMRLRGTASTGGQTRSWVGHHEPLLVPPLVVVAQLQGRIRSALTQRKGSAAHHITASGGRVPSQVVQGPPQVEVWGDPQERLTQVDKDRDLRDRVRLEMSYLEPIEEKEPAEEGPRGKAKPFS